MASGPKKIPFDRLLSRSYWTWRANPALSVPTMFSTGLTALAQSILGIFGIALLVRLEGTPWLRQIASDVSTSNFTDLANLIQSSTFLSVVLEYMLPGAAVAIVVLILANGFVYSAEYGSYWQAQAGIHVGISEVMSNFVKKWRQMAWTVFLSSLFALLPLIAGLVIEIYLLFTRALLLVVVIGLLVLLVGFVLTAILSLLFIYTPIVVIADDLSGLAAIKRSITQVRKNLGISFAYGLVLVVLTGAASLFASLIPFVNLAVSSLVSVGILILLTPVMHLLKTEIYSEALKPELVPFEVYKPFLPDLVGGLPKALLPKFIQGLRDLKDFVLNPRNAVYHLLSAGGLILGWIIGIWIGNNGLTQVIYASGYVSGKINPAITGSAPLVVGIYIFFHNWEASLATALSGVWFPLIPFVTLLLNGTLIGVVSDVVPNTTMLVAALAPHGVIELPSFVLAGSAGIRLGVAFLRSFSNPRPETATTFQMITKQTVYLVIGLAILFLIAGFIEGNITPIIMRMAGWS